MASRYRSSLSLSAWGCCCSRRGPRPGSPRRGDHLEARLVKGGKAVDVQVTVTCPTGAEVLEAVLYVNPDRNRGEFTFFQPICKGNPRTFTVRA